MLRPRINLCSVGQQGSAPASELCPAVAHGGLMLAPQVPHPAQVVKRYYAKRLRRMLPSYYATLAIIYTMFLPLLRLGNARAPEAQRAIGTLWFNEGDGCPGRLWTNFIFANNQVKRAGCMKYAWSQAVQVSSGHATPCMHISLVLLNCCGMLNNGQGSAC